MKPEAKSSVLLVAHDSTQAQLVSQVLVGVPANDFALHVTHNISDALCHSRAGAVCAVILDIDMPIGVGLEVFDQLFDSARHLPFLIVCGPTNE
jgi:DNA-binding NtrC family response regulator